MNETATPAAAAPAAAAEVVKMEDGREVTFAGKKRMIKTSTIDEAAQAVSVRFDFRNGKVLNFTVPPSLLLKFAAHGAEQKIGDETAGETDVDDAHLAVKDLVERLDKGEWNVARAAGGFAGTSVLLRALVEFSGKSTEDIAAFLKGKSPAEKQAMRASPQLQPIVQKLEAEKAAKATKVDVGALFGALSG